MEQDYLSASKKKAIAVFVEVVNAIVDVSVAKTTSAVMEIAVTVANVPVIVIAILIKKNKTYYESIVGFIFSINSFISSSLEKII